jgi:hypothetical protein
LDLLSFALAGMLVVAVVGVCWSARTVRELLYIGAFGFLAAAIIGLDAVRNVDSRLAKLNEFVWIALGVLAAFGILFELYEALRLVWRSGKQREP